MFHSNGKHFSKLHSNRNNPVIDSSGWFCVVSELNQTLSGRTNLPDAVWSSQSASKMCRHSSWNVVIFRFWCPWQTHEMSINFWPRIYFWNEIIHNKPGMQRLGEFRHPQSCFLTLAGEFWESIYHLSSSGRTQSERVVSGSKSRPSAGDKLDF